MDYVMSGWRRGTIRLAAAVMLLTAAAAAAEGQQDRAAEAAVRQAEAARFAAMAANDVTALEPMLGDDLVYTHSTAQVETKREFLQNMRDGTIRYVSIAARDQVVRVYGEAAVITGGATITSVNRGQKRLSVLRYTDVWVQRDGRWQMVTWQSTRVPDEP